MGNQTSQPLSKDLGYLKLTNFLPSEIKEWSSAFKSLYPNGKMKLKDFTSFFAALFPFGRVEPFCTRLFQNINIRQERHIELGELLIAFTILFKGSAFERLRWVFRFYDDDKDGFVSREELEGGLRIINMLVSDSLMTEIPYKSLVDEIFTSLKKQNGMLSFSDFERLAEGNSENFKRISLFFD